MRKLSDTIGRLSALNARSSPSDGTQGPALLKPLEDFGPNPGALAGWAHIPATAGRDMPLVVVLHGCTQNAQDYARGSGWLQLADELGFALLLPEQRRSNNLNLCFNWYERGDNCRGSGEAASIRQMIEAMTDRFAIDSERIFVNGLSAGGAMTSVMLATYPEVFAGGAIIAGLPYGSANGVPEAFDRMRGHGGPDGAGMAALVRAAAPAYGRWPSISVWHGDADHTVSANNGDDIIEQWRLLHGAPKDPAESDFVDGYPHRVWRDVSGRAVIQNYRITGMGHGTPLATSGSDACGVPGAYMLDVAISSTRRIAYDWGLGGNAPARNAARVAAAGSRKALPVGSANDRTPSRTVGGVQETIETALRAAGLMR